MGWGARAGRERNALTNLSNHTIKTHVSRIFAETGSGGRAAAIGYARRHDIS